MSPCSIRRDKFRGWNACYLENDFVRLVAVPDIGGRIMGYDLGPYPFFYVDPDLAGKLFSPEENQGDGSLGAWKNYGGDKTWPAPQGWDNDQQWHGPPDPVLDSGRYSLHTLEQEGEQAVIAMTSPPDTRTGVQITRRFTLAPASSRVRVDITFTNITDHTIRWGIWDVAQLRAEHPLGNGQTAYEPTCTVTAPLNPHSKFARGFNVMFGLEDNPQWQTDAASGLFIAPYLWHIGKVGLDSPGGWIAFSHSAAGYAFAERFTVDPGAEYPDQGATVEVWTVGTGRVGNFNYDQNPVFLMETEVLGPLRTIPPQGETSFNFEWGVCRCTGPVIAANEAGCLSAPLLVERLSDGYARLTVSAGVFDAGELELIGLDAQRQRMMTHQLGPVDPFSVIHLDRIIRMPAHASSLVLQVAAGKHLAGTPLAEVWIE